MCESSQNSCLGLSYNGNNYYMSNRIVNCLSLQVTDDTSCSPRTRWIYPSIRPETKRVHDTRSSNLRLIWRDGSRPIQNSIFSLLYPRVLRSASGQNRRLVYSRPTANFFGEINHNREQSGSCIVLSAKNGKSISGGT